MLITRYKPFLNRCVEPLARRLAHWGVTPNALTLGGLALGALCCLFFVLTRQTVAFCLLILAAGLCDVLDGAVARVSHRTTKFGAYLDAMADRYFEAMVAVSVAYVTGYWLLSLIVLAGAFAISYAKARAGLEVPVSNTEWPDGMERAERSALFVAGLLLSALVPWRPGGHDLFYWTLIGLAVATHATVWQRMRRAQQLIAERSTR